MSSAAKVVVFAGAISEKPANRRIIQSSSTAKKGMGMELPSREPSNLPAIARANASKAIAIGTTG
jgi:hypothetical protein